MWTYLTLNAPFTPDEDCLAIGRNSGNPHLSFVVVPSLLVVATVQRTLS